MKPLVVMMVILLGFQNNKIKEQHWMIKLIKHLIVVKDLKVFKEVRIGEMMKTLTNQN